MDIIHTAVKASGEKGYHTEWNAPHTIQDFIQSATYIVSLTGKGTHTDIQTAIDDLGGDGGLIVIREGEYEYAAPIDIDKSNVHLVGMGASTIIRPTHNVDAFDVGDAANPFENISIDNLLIDGQNTATKFGIHFTREITNSLVQNCFITQYTQGIRLAWTSQWNRILGNHFYDVGTSVLLHNACDYNTLSGNVLKACTIHFIQMDVARYNTIINNILQGTSVNSYGIWVKDSYNNVISGNFITLAGFHGIFLNSTGIGNDSDFNVISGNSLYHNCQQNNNTWDEILVTGGSQGNSITGNVIVAGGANAARYGIMLNAAVDTENTCVSNRVTGAVTGNIQDNGAANDVAHNVTA